MRAKLRVLTGTVVLALLAGLAMGAGQPPARTSKPALPAPPAPASATFVVDSSASVLSGAVVELQWSVAADEVKVAPRNLLDVHLAEVADNQLRNAQVERLQAFREQAKVAQLQSAANQEYSAARAMRFSGGQPGGVALSAGSGYFGKTPYAGRDSNGNGGRSHGDPADARRAELAQYLAFQEAATSQADHASYASALAKKSMDKQLALKVKNAESPPAAPNPPPVALPPPSDSIPSYDDEPRPVVYRAGHPAPGLPDWFTRLDTDHDGQVGLYEWKVSGRSLAEFAAIDRNDDGLITPEEMLWYLAHQPGGRSAGPTVAVASRP